uniref:Sodium-dependent serotonin transporter n=1 Tax=Ditylenchus dipsaci TaxID=166011 RepID=A0A915E3X0_9BILA
MLRWSSVKRRDFYYTSEGRTKYGTGEFLSPDVYLQENHMNNDEIHPRAAPLLGYDRLGRKYSLFPPSPDAGGSGRRRVSINTPCISYSNNSKNNNHNSMLVAVLGGRIDDDEEECVKQSTELLPKPAISSRKTSFCEYTTIQNGGSAVAARIDTQGGVSSISARRRRSSVVREKWASKLEFLLAVIGYAVDLGNIWRFPSICYKHGGARKLFVEIVEIFGHNDVTLNLWQRSISYSLCGHVVSWWIADVLHGISFGSIPQIRLSEHLEKICPMFKGIGYGICFICTFISCFYNAIIAHAVYFFISSLAWEVPWKTCNNTWNSEFCRESLEGFENVNNSAELKTPSQEFYLFKVLETQFSTGFDDLGGVKPSMAFCLLIVFIIVYFALWKGPRSTGKVVWVTATAPYIVLTILLIRGLTLPGAGKGISYYLTPDFDKLWEPTVWTAAATQIFFSLGPGFGVLLALSSYNDFNNNCYRDALVTSLINCFTSFSLAFGWRGRIFLDFRGLSQAIATMSYSSVWSLIFFLMLITLGIDSTFSGIEALITGFATTVVITTYYIGSLPTVTYGGTYVIPFLDEYGVSLSVLFIVMCEMIAVCWFYGVQRFSEDIRVMLGFYPGLYWRVCWTCCPVFIGIIFVLALYSTSFSPLSVPNYTYPQWSVPLGWLFRMLSCLSIPTYAIYLLLTTSGTLKERFKLCITAQQRHPSMNSNCPSLTPNIGGTLLDERGNYFSHRDSSVAHL